MAQVRGKKSCFPVKRAQDAGSLPSLLCLSLVACALPFVSAESQSSSTIRVIANDSALTQEDRKLERAERALLDSFALESAASTTPTTVAQTKVAAPKTVEKKLPAKPESAAPPTTDSAVKAVSSTTIESSPSSTVAVRDTDTSKELQALRAQTEKLSKDLEEATGRIISLTKEIDESKTQLMVSETEINRLSAMLAKKNGSAFSGTASASVARRPEVAQRSADYPPVQPVAAMARMNPSTGDTELPARDKTLPVATVSVDKADLRIGPGISTDKLMTLPRGARVVVETRQGEWYRVFTPSGERAWVHSSLVTFGDKVTPMNDSSAARVRGFDSALEDRAFRSIAGK